MSRPSEARALPAQFRIRPADPSDAESIASAHLDSIRSLGPFFYSDNVVHEWGANIHPTMYTSAMARGELFFVAVDATQNAPEVVGFSSTGAAIGEHRIAVYVRGAVARRGVGSALLREAERVALSHGATAIDVDASLAAVEFYRSNGFESLGAGEHRLRSGTRMACVFMRKRLESRDSA